MRFALALGVLGFVAGRHLPVGERVVVAVAPQPAPTTRTAHCSPDIPTPDPDPTRGPEVLASGDPLIARIPVLASDGSPGREAIVRSVDGGWCTLVPGGPPLVAAVEGDEWVWFAQGSPVVLARVPIDGGPVRAVTTLPVMPDSLTVNDGRLTARRNDDAVMSEWISDLLMSSSAADASAVRLPRVPRGSNRRPAIHGDILRVPVGDYTFADTIVRITRTGWCTLVPPGAPAELLVAHGWVWFVRAESMADHAPHRLYRVSARGGPIEMIATVPFLPTRMNYRDHDLIATDADQRRWIRAVTDDSPTAATCD